MQEEERGVEGRRVRRMQGKEKSGKMSRVAWVGSLVEFFRKQEPGSIKSRKGGAYSTMSVSSRSRERVYALKVSSVVQGWRN